VTDQSLQEGLAEFGVTANPVESMLGVGYVLSIGAGLYWRQVANVSRKEAEALLSTFRRIRAEAQGVPKGWRLVPVEPCVEMLSAFWRVKNGHHFHDEPPPEDTSDYAAYRAMLSAAPLADGGGTPSTLGGSEASTGTTQDPQPVDKDLAEEVARIVDGIRLELLEDDDGNPEGARIVGDEEAVAAILTLVSERVERAESEAASWKADAAVSHLRAKALEEALRQVADRAPNIEPPPFSDCSAGPFWEAGQIARAALSTTDREKA
jgi:hypothetical protein